MQQFQTPSYIHEYLIMEMKSYGFKYEIYTYKYIYIYVYIIYTYIYKSINRYDKDKGGRRERDR